MGEDTQASQGEYTIKKKVDETWKNAVELEKVKVDQASPKSKSPTETPPAATETPETEFTYFISSLGMQALAAMGEIPDPMSGQGRQDLRQAKYLLDTLQLLHTKTQGNLTPEEAAVFEDLLYQLRLKFVQKSQAL